MGARIRHALKLQHVLLNDTVLFGGTVPYFPSFFYRSPMGLCSSTFLRRSVWWQFCLQLCPLIKRFVEEVKSELQATPTFQPQAAAHAVMSDHCWQPGRTSGVCSCGLAWASRASVWAHRRPRWTCLPPSTTCRYWLKGQGNMTRISSQLQLAQNCILYKIICVEADFNK